MPLLIAVRTRSCALLIGVLALTGCIAPKVIEYTAFHDREFPQRGAAAQIQQKSTAELIDTGYLLIGYIDLRRNVRTCYQEGQCVDHSDVLPSTDDVRQEAAARGGDVVTLLEERTVLEQNDKSVCTNMATMVRMVNNVPQVITYCSAYRSVPGKLEAKITRALIWRHDPDAARGEANARAIDNALKTLEAAHRAEEAKSLSAGRSFLGNASKPKDEGAGRADDAADEEIYRAIAANDRRALQTLARAGRLSAWKDPKGRSALMVAFLADRPDAVRTLLALDKDVNRRDRSGLSALHYAAARADVALVRELVNAGHDLRAKTSDGASLLFYALYNPRVEVFEWLLTQRLDPRERTAREETTLMIAAEAAAPSTLRRLLDLGVPINERDRDGRSALLSAARSGRPDAVDFLLRARADVRAADNDGNTALHYAATGGKREVVRTLLGRGLNINAENKSAGTPLIVALGAEQWEAASYLIDRGAALTTSKYTAEDTAAFLISKNQPRLLQRYITAFPPLKELLARDPDWLQYAAKTSGRETIKFMVDLGARVDRPGTDGVAPLLVAATAGNAAAVRALLELKADPVARDRRGYTALKTATLGGHAKVVEALRQFGVKE